MTMLDTREIINTALYEHDIDAGGHRDDRLDSLSREVEAALAGDLNDIPAYSSHSAPLSLVSFRCLLQDTGYPMEVYIPGSAVPADGQDADMRQLRERWVGWGVEVPGQSSWVGEKPHISSAGATSLTNGVSSLSLNGTAPHPAALQSKFPVPSLADHYLGALIKVYDDAATFRPASLHTFIGLVSRAPLPMPLSGNDTEEDEAHLLVPTIHVLKGPLSAEPTLPQYTPPSTSATLTTATSPRSRLISYLSSLFPHPDTLCAEYLLLLLLSRPAIRPIGLAPLGTLSLNLIGHPSALAQSLTKLSHLVPSLVDINLTLPLLHSTHFNPHSTDSSSLDAGHLQLAPGTVLVIDESGMGDGGKLEERAVKNIRALTDCLGEQKLRYEYPFMADLKMDVEIKGVVCSEGKSLIPVDVHVPVLTARAGTDEKEELPIDTTRSTPTADELNEFRAFLQYHGSSQHATKLTIPDDVGEVIQDEFVAARASASGSASDSGANNTSARSGTSGTRQSVEEAESALKRRMRIARLMALSYPDATLSRQVWAKVVSMDNEAQERLVERSKAREGPARR